MPITSTVYFNMPGKVQVLKEQLRLQTEAANIIRKSEDNASLTKLAQGLGNSLETVHKLATEVYQQFLALKQDFAENKVTRAKYADQLKPLFDLLTTASEKIVIPGFDANAVAAELKIAGFK